MHKGVDISDVIGQEHAKRAIEVAAVSKANVLFVGGLGNGKGMLSEAYAGLLGNVEVIRISVADTVKSLARKFDNGTKENVLIIVDELPELKRDVLLYIKEMSQTWNIPVVASMLPCPCGYLSDPRHSCTCTPAQVGKYRAPVSGSLGELFDIHIGVPPVPVKELLNNINGTGYQSENTEKVLSRVIPARERYRVNQNKLKPCNDAVDLLSTACQRLGFSAKAVAGIQKVSRAIADLESEDVIKSHHIAEAIQYRARQ